MFLFLSMYHSGSIAYRCQPLNLNSFDFQMLAGRNSFMGWVRLCLLFFNYVIVNEYYCGIIDFLHTYVCIYVT